MPSRSKGNLEAASITTWTRNGILRHPSFDDVCEGVAPESVVMEQPLSIKEATQ
jgi:hypothetical protein